jgi:DNA-binding LacI/PurR family transcriptional regulator
MAAQQAGYQLRDTLYGPKNRRRTGYVGLLMLGVHEKVLRLPHIAELLINLEKVLSRYSFQLVLANSANGYDLPALVNTKRMDGVLVIGYAHAKIRQLLSRLNCVLLYGAAHEPDDPAWADWITPDYFKIGELAAKNLIDRGHRRLGYFNLTPGNPGTTEEVSWGFEKACRNVSIKPIILEEASEKNNPIWNGIQYSQQTRHLMSKLLDMPSDNRPTGILVSEYSVIRTVYDVIIERGLRPGDDIEVVSRVHEESYLSALSPRPASISTSRQQMAEQVVERLLYRMRNPDAPAGIRIMIPPTLIQAKNGGKKRGK